MSEYIELTDGTRIAGHCINDGERLYVYLTEISLAAAYPIFSDAAKIRTIREVRWGNEHIHQGYTELGAISTEYGNVNLVLRR